MGYKGLCLGLCLAVSWVKAAPSHLLPETTYQPQLELDFKTGNLRGLMRAGALIPLYQNQQGLVFVNLFGVLDSQSSQEGNLGLGYRHRLVDSIVGFYGFWDRRKSAHGNMFSQWTLGTEWLKENLEFRVNGYVPITSKKSLNTSFKVGRSQLAFVQPGFEQALGGYDVEVGGSLPQAPFLHGFVTYYHLMGRGVKPVHGIRLRSRVDVNNYIKLEAEVSHDRLRGTQVLAGLKLTLPLDGIGTSSQGLTGLERKMTQMVVRDIDIVTADVKHNRVFWVDDDSVGHESPDNTPSPSPTIADDLASLGLSSQVDWGTVKKIYRRLMRALHPDKQSNQIFQNAAQAKRYHRVRDAYERLERHFQAHTPSTYQRSAPADRAHRQAHLASNALLRWQKPAHEGQVWDDVVMTQHHPSPLNRNSIFTTQQLAGGERTGVQAVYFASSHEAWVERRDGRRLKVKPWDIVGIPNHLPKQHLDTFLNQSRFSVSKAGEDIRVRIDGRLRGGMLRGSAGQSSNSGHYPPPRIISVNKVLDTVGGYYLPPRIISSVSKLPGSHAGAIQISEVEAMERLSTEAAIKSLNQTSATASFTPQPASGFGRSMSTLPSSTSDSSYDANAGYSYSNMLPTQATGVARPVSASHQVPSAGLSYVRMQTEHRHREAEQALRATEDHTQQSHVDFQQQRHRFASELSNLESQFRDASVDHFARFSHDQAISQIVEGLVVGYAKKLEVTLSHIRREFDRAIEQVRKNNSHKQDDAKRYHQGRVDDIQRHYTTQVERAEQDYAWASQQADHRVNSAELDNGIFRAAHHDMGRIRHEAAAAKARAAQALEASHRSASNQRESDMRSEESRYLNVQKGLLADEKRENERLTEKRRQDELNASARLRDEQARNEAYARKGYRDFSEQVQQMAEQWVASSAHTQATESTLKSVSRTLSQARRFHGHIQRDCYFHFPQGRQLIEELKRQQSYLEHRLYLQLHSEPPTGLEASTVQSLLPESTHRQQRLPLKTLQTARTQAQTLHSHWQSLRAEGRLGFAQVADGIKAHHSEISDEGLNKLYQQALQPYAEHLPVMVTRLQNEHPNDDASALAAHIEAIADTHSMLNRHLDTSDETVQSNLARLNLLAWGERYHDFEEALSLAGQSDVPTLLHHLRYTSELNTLPDDLAFRSVAGMAAQLKTHQASHSLMERWLKVLQTGEVSESQWQQQLSQLLPGIARAETEQLSAAVQAQYLMQVEGVELTQHEPPLPPQNQKAQSRYEREFASYMYGRQVNVSTLLSNHQAKLRTQHQVEAFQRLVDVEGVQAIEARLAHGTYDILQLLQDRRNILKWHTSFRTGSAIKARLQTLGALVTSRYMALWLAPGQAGTLESFMMPWLRRHVAGDVTRRNSNRYADYMDTLSGFAQNATEAYQDIEGHLKGLYQQGFLTPSILQDKLSTWVNNLSIEASRYLYQQLQRQWGPWLPQADESQAEVVASDDRYTAPLQVSKGYQAVDGEIDRLYFANARLLPHPAWSHIDTGERLLRGWYPKKLDGQWHMSLWQGVYNRRGYLIRLREYLDPAELSAISVSLRRREVASSCSSAGSNSAAPNQAPPVPAPSSVGGGNPPSRRDDDFSDSDDEDESSAISFAEWLEDDGFLLEGTRQVVRDIEGREAEEDTSPSIRGHHTQRYGMAQENVKSHQSNRGFWGNFSDSVWQSVVDSQDEIERINRQRQVVYTGVAQGLYQAFTGQESSRLNSLSHIFQHGKHFSSVVHGFDYADAIGQTGVYWLHSRFVQPVVSGAQWVWDSQPHYLPYDIAYSMIPYVYDAAAEARLSRRNEMMGGLWSNVLHPGMELGVDVSYLTLKHGILQSRDFHIESMQERIDRRIYASRQFFAQASYDYEQMSGPERIKLVGPFVLDGFTLGIATAPQANRTLTYTSAGLAHYARRMPVFNMNRGRGFLGESFVFSRDSFQFGGAVRGSVGDANIFRGSTSFSNQHTLSTVKGWLEKSTRLSEHQFQYIFKDGSKVIFRRDFGKHAHPIRPKYSSPVEHYNIELQIRNKLNQRFDKVKNIHVIIKDGKIKEVI